jgi:hypothetical protein
MKTLKKQWVFHFNTKLYEVSRTGEVYTIMKIGWIIDIQVALRTEFTLLLKIGYDVFDELSILPKEKYFHLSISMLFDPIVGKYSLEVRVNSILVLTKSYEDATVRNGITLIGGNTKSTLKDIVFKNAE